MDNGMMKSLIGKLVDPQNRHVCPNCISDTALRGRVEEAVSETERCTYCRREEATALEVVLEAVREALSITHLEDARAPGFPPETGQELVQHELVDWTDNETLLLDVAECLNETFWLPRGVLGYSEVEELAGGWDLFENTIKHETRYLFFDREFKHLSIPPSKMLDELGQLLSEHDLVTTLEAGTDLYRARVGDEDEFFTTAEELGTPPPERVTRSNRMSGIGIPMFYGALDERTAVVETYEPEEGKAITVGRFRPLEPLKVMDFSELPRVPSQFSPEAEETFHGISFLHQFVNDLAKPVARDAKEHINYIPTQVVTEYLRHRWRSTEGESIDGIVYKSSRLDGDRSVVLFLEAGQCGRRSREGMPELVEQAVELVGHRRYLPGSVLMEVSSSEGARSRFGKA